MKKVLGINISHNFSVAYFENNILKEYYEEDRFNKIKNFSPPYPLDGPYDYKALKKFKDITFDSITFVTFTREELVLEKLIIDNILRQVNCKNVKFYHKEHHIFHAVCGYYFSNFDTATAVVTDGGGDRIYKYFQTVESIFTINKKKIKTHYKNASNIRYYYFEDSNEKISVNKNNIDKYDITLNNKYAGGLKYLKYREDAGFKEFEEGQLMGIAAYKNKNKNLDKNVLEIAYKAQEETLQERIELIEKALTYSDCKNIILSGGYHLNCSNNFKLIKHFPKLNIFVDPIPYDGGTAVGGGYFYGNY